MGASFEVKGFEELSKMLNQLGRKGAKVENDALKEGANIILEAAKANAPVLSGKGRDGLKISKVKKKGGTKFVLVGIEKTDNSDIFYMKFHEFGSSKMAARPFLGPAYEANKDQVIKTIMEQMKRGLGL